MSELVIQATGFTIQPLVSLRDGPCEIRWWYSRSFLDSNGIQVNHGTGTTGFRITTPCSIASGLISVDQDTLLWTTDDAQDPTPQSISLSAGLFTSRGQLIQQLTITGKSQWVVPSSLAPTTTWENFSAYNQAVELVNPPLIFYTAPQIDALVDRAFDEHPANDTELGTVFTSVPPSLPDQPVAWITDDPLVRDAVKIQGVDVSPTPPLDSQILTFNQANNQYEPGNQAAGIGNVVSNEVVSVDGELTLFSGTGGKTIKRGDQTGLLRGTSGVVAASTVGTSDVDDAAITFPKIQDVATDRLLGRDTAGSGEVEELSVGGGLEFTGAGGIQRSALTGDVTAAAGSDSTAIADNAVPNSKLADVPTQTIKGRTAAGSGDPEDLTGTQATALLDNMVGDSGAGGAKGLAPAPAAGDAAAGKFLKADGTWAAPSGTGAPSDATYITQTPNGGLSAEQALSALSTGLLKNTTGTGVLSIGAAGTDYVEPGGALGTPSSGTLTNCTADGTNGVGFKNVPQNSQSANYTTVLGDAGWHIYHPVSDDNPRTYTIDSNANVPYPIGTAITFINDQNTLTIAITADTLVWAEDGSTGSRTLAENGIATAIKVTSTRWIISGTGLS